MQPLMKSAVSASAVRTFSSKARNVVVVDGGRIPFNLSSTVYNDYIAVDLARFALKGLLVKSAIDPKLIDYLCMGTVIQESRTSKYVVKLFLFL
jgi:acetyl-CoA acetyltransferase